MTNADVVFAVLVNGRPYQKMPDGTLVPIVDRTDDFRLDAMSSSEVEALADSDEHGPPMSDAEWAEAEIGSGSTVAVGLRLDRDVLEWFKAGGRGYQARIASVLRRYVETRRRTG